MIALLGQNQSTEASSTHASATAGLEVTHDIRDGDARLVEAALNQLLRWVTDLNEGEQAPAPTVELFEEEDVATELATRDETLTRSGLQFSRAYWLRAYKLEEADLVDQVDRPAAPQPGTDVAFAEGDAAGDAIDAAVRDELQGWRPLIDPMVKPLQALLDDAARRGLTAAEVIAELPSLLQTMDDAALADALTRLSFAARAAAQAGGPGDDA